MGELGTTRGFEKWADWRDLYVRGRRHRNCEGRLTRHAIRSSPIRLGTDRKLRIMWPSALHLSLYAIPDSGQQLIHLLVELSCIFYVTHVMVEKMTPAVARRVSQRKGGGR